MPDVRWRRLIPIGDWFDRARPSSRTLSDEDRAAVIGELFFEPEERTAYLWRFGVLIVLSTALAALGLIADSVAVIIGAMLVAPLMTPMLGMAASLVLADPVRLLRSFGVLVGGTLLAILTGYIVALTAPGGQAANQLTQEILARADPSLLDLFVAVAAGLAGGYVLTHPRASAALAGVAIAVALVPPLATVGITLALGATDEAQGALLLFLTNFVAIVLSALIVMVASGFTPEEIRASRGSRATIGIVVSLVALGVLAIPLGVHSVQVLRDQRFTSQVVDALEEWDPQAEIVELQAGVASGRGDVELVISTSEIPAPAWELADTISAELGIIVDVQLRVIRVERSGATSG